MTRQPSQWKITILAVKISIRSPWKTHNTLVISNPYWFLFPEVSWLLDQHGVGGLGGVKRYCGYNSTLKSGRCQTQSFRYFKSQVWKEIGDVNKGSKAIFYHPSDLFLRQYFYTLIMYIICMDCFILWFKVFGNNICQFMMCNFNYIILLIFLS